MIRKKMTPNGTVYYVKKMCYKTKDYDRRCRKFYANTRKKVKLIAKDWLLAQIRAGKAM